MSGAVTRREFSVRYVWNGAGARLRWNTSFPARTFGSYVKQTQENGYRKKVRVISYYVNQGFRASG